MGLPDDEKMVTKPDEHSLKQMEARNADALRAFYDLDSLFRQMDLRIGDEATERDDYLREKYGE